MYFYLLIFLSKATINTLRLIGPIFVSRCMLFNGSPTKAHRHFLTNAFCYRRTRI